VAACILAENYPMEADEMDLSQKLNRLLNQAKLNENVKRNSIHISLNFAPGEQLSNAVLIELVRDYMTQLGFGEQPYLVYRHEDAAHPHIHIVTTKIKADGTRIDTQNMGRNQSEQARKMLEEKHGLVKAEEHKQVQVKRYPEGNIAANYGKMPTKNAITHLLNHVLFSYKYTSLPELNAVLRNYNLVADRGQENSRVYRFNGLYYHLLDNDGNKVGVPIKASNIYNNPGLKFLTTEFESNKIKRNAGKKHITAAIDLALKTAPQTIDQLVEQLSKSYIQLICRTNPEGLIYGLTYIDHRTKCVFNGSALGKMYSAKGIMEGFASLAIPGSERKNIHKQLIPAALSLGSNDDHFNKDFIELLTQAEQFYESVPFQLKRPRKKRKMKRFTNLN
jgi:hypothetical protein